MGNPCAGGLRRRLAMTGLSGPVQVSDVVGARHARPRERRVPGALIVEEFEAVRMRLPDAARGPVEPSGGLFEALDPWSGCRPAIRLHSRDIGWRLRRSGGRQGDQRYDCPMGESKSSAKHSDLPPPANVTAAYMARSVPP